MATAQASAAPAAGITTLPSGPDSAAREPSGVAWVTRFPTSAQVADCVQPFRANLTAFIAALRAAGAAVSVAATLRPVQRAYLMHWCWSIVKAKVDSRSVPTLDGVAIAWAHDDAQGDYDAAASLAAAQAMVRSPIRRPRNACARSSRR